MEDGGPCLYVPKKFLKVAAKAIGSAYSLKVSGGRGVGEFDFR